MAQPSPGPHDDAGNRGLWNPATQREAPQDEDPLTAGRRVFEATREPTDAPASEPKEGAAHQTDYE